MTRENNRHQLASSRKTHCRASSTIFFILAACSICWVMLQGSIMIQLSSQISIKDSTLMKMVEMQFFQNLLQQQQQQQHEPVQPVQSLTVRQSTNTPQPKKNVAGNVSNEQKEDENLIANEKLKSHGFGVDIWAMAGRLIEAGKLGKQRQVIKWHDGWLYAKGVCPAEDLTCFFEPHPPMNMEGSSNPTTLGEAIKQLLVLKPETQKELDQLPGLVPSPIPPNEACAVLHVRHADTALNHEWNRSQTPLLRFLHFWEYIEAYRHHFKNHQKPRHLVLLTDDQNVIDLVPNYDNATDLQLHYIERKRFRGSEGGFENHFPSGSQKGELLTLLKIRQVVQHCQLWVGTTSSFAKVLWLLMDQPPKVVLLNNKVPMTNDTVASLMFHGAKLPSWMNSKKNMIRFRPGALKDITRPNQTLQHCYDDGQKLVGDEFWAAAQTKDPSQPYSVSISDNDKVHIQITNPGNESSMEQQHQYDQSTPCQQALLAFCCWNVPPTSPCDTLTDQMYCMLERPSPEGMKIKAWRLQDPLVNAKTTN